jgi:hypothetical protein
MRTEPNQPNQKENKFPIKHVVYAIIVTIIGIVALSSCLYFGTLIAGSIFMGIMMSSGESVLHSDPNPDNTIIVHVVSDGCGATCDCTTRVDISYGDDKKQEIYRDDACDLEIKWLDNYRFEVIDKLGETVVLDARDYEGTP